mgnify:CR=1 FL=1
MSLREISLSEAGTEIEVPVDAAWGPGAYIAITAYRPGEAREGRPARALGLAWIGLDPAPRRLEVAITAPERIRPRQRVEIPIRIADARGEAMVTLAAVDEGILRLTGFTSPDPVAHFLGRRALGVDIRDDYGRLLAPAEGALALLRQGGDGGLTGMGIQPPQKLVSLFSGPVRVGADGTAVFALDIPDFAGELRLMAVAWEGNRIGAASRPMIVRDQAVVEAALPRFLAPGDTARLPVLMHNIELPAGEIVAELSTEGALAIEGPTRLTARLATGERAAPATGELPVVPRFGEQISATGIRHSFLISGSRTAIVSEEDRIVWDVGHQSYPHKILTGRREQMPSLRKKGGLKGFPSRDESPYDTFGVGHSSTSISAALGMAMVSHGVQVRVVAS